MLVRLVERYQSISLTLDLTDGDKPETISVSGDRKSNDRDRPAELEEGL